MVIDFASFGWLEFIPTLVATFLGVLLAFAFDSWLSRKAEKRVLQRSQEEKRQRKLFILTSLREDAEHNHEVLKNLREELERASPIPDYFVSLEFWHMFGSESLQALEDSHSIQCNLQFYQNLEHLAQSLSLYSQLIARIDASGITWRHHTLNRLKQRVARGMDLEPPLLTVVTKKIELLSN